MKRGRYIPFILPLVILAAAGNVFGVTPEDLQAMVERKDNLIIVDARRNIDYARAHIPGAINIPALACESKHLPPVGRVVVYGDGVLPDDADTVTNCLNRKTGIRAEVMDGGFPSWQELNLPGTEAPGVNEMKHPYLLYADLVRAVETVPDLVIVDLRNPEDGPASAEGAGKDRRARTDLSARFPSVRQVDLRNVVAEPGGSGKAAGRVLAGRKPGAHPLYVFVDDADGTAEEVAMKLRASGVRRLAILTGGEYALEREGKPGLGTLSPRSAP